MKTTKFLIVIVLVFLFIPSCSAKQEIVSTPVEIEPTETTEPTSDPIENTLTPIVYRVGEVIDFVRYNAETKSDVDDTPKSWEPGERILPAMEEDGSWIFKNRVGPQIKVRVVEKTDKFTTTWVLTSQKEYEIEASRGGIILFEIGAPEWGDSFLFSPDVGEAGYPIDCLYDKNQLFCYYPSSLGQFVVFGEGLEEFFPEIEEGTIEKMVEEIEGWCVDYQNVSEADSMNEDATTDTYMLPNEEYYTWTEDNCPYFKITEITE